MDDKEYKPDENLNQAMAICKLEGAEFDAYSTKILVMKSEGEISQEEFMDALLKYAQDGIKVYP